MSELSKYYNDKEKYILSEDKRHCLDECFSYSMRICYQLLYLQVYNPSSSLREQKNLLDMLNDSHLSCDGARFKRILERRYYMLLQGAKPELLPSVQEFIQNECSFSYSASKPMISKNQTVSNSYPSSLSESFIMNQLQYDAEKWYCSEEFYEYLLTQKPSKDRAYKLLTMVHKRGLPGVVDTIMTYLSTVDKKEISSAVFFIDLLSFENMDDLRNRVKKTYRFDLFTNSSFCEQYMMRFGKIDLVDDSDPHVGEMVEATIKRRIEFIRENKLSHLGTELDRLLRHQSSRGVFDKDVFMEYLKLNALDESGKKQYRPRSVNTLSEKFLTHFFPKESPSQFLPYLMDYVVMRMYEKSLLLRGDDIKVEYMTESQVDDLKNERICNLLPCNKMYYNEGDDVFVHLELKNTPHLDILVFEVNTLSYFRSNSSPITESIDVDGLVPQFSLSMSYDQPSIVSHKEVFSFPTIKRRGVYIIDFVAGQSNCRFILYMGCLNVFSRTCLAGYALTIVDERGQRLEKDVKILMEEREFELNENHEIIIPYLPCTDYARTVNLLICQKQENNWSYVKRHSLKLEPESITLSVTGTVDNEALVPGNEDCTLLLRVVAELNGCYYPLHFLTNVVITLEFTDIQGMKSEKILTPSEESLKDSCIPYTFRVKEGYSRIVASVTAKAVYNNGTKKTIDSSRKVLFGANSVFSSSSTPVKKVDVSLRLFRKKEEERLVYVLQAVGPAGECIPCQQYEVEIMHKYYKNSHSVTLETDSNGQIHLGELKNVRWIKAGGQRFEIISDALSIQTHWETVDCYPIQVQIPVIEKEVDHYYLSCEECYEDYSTVTPTIQYETGYLRVFHLPAGSYHLYLYLNNGDSYDISINVDRSSQEPVVYEDYLMYGNGALFLEDLPLSLHCAIDSNKLSIQVNGKDDATSVYVLCKTFADSMMVGRDLDACTLFLPKGECSVHHLSCIRASDRTFSDEYGYILERQKHQRLLPGSMLPAPGLLLNPVEYADTTTTNQRGGNGSDYQSKATGASELSRKHGSTISRKVKPSDSVTKSSVNNILHPSLIFSVPLNEEGQAIVDLPSFADSGYEVCVVCMNHYQVVENHLYCDQEEDKTVTKLLKPQALETGLDSTKHYTEEKTITVVQNGDRYQLNNKSDLEILTSLSDIWLLLKTLSGDSTLQSFSFLLEWDTLSLEEKKVCFNRFNCAELYIFVYFKDSSFFNTVVKPYLKSKIEKSFLDHFLVDDDLSEFLLPSRYERLNAFEKALLTSRLPEEFGDKVVKGMQETARFKEMSEEKYNRIFETALKLKAMNKEDTVKVVEAFKNECEDRGEDEESACDDETTAQPFECYCQPRYLAADEDMDLPIPGALYAPPQPMMCGAVPVPMTCETPSPVCQPRIASLPRMMGRNPERLNLHYAAPRCCMKSLREKSDESVYKEQKVEKLYERMEKAKEYVEGYYYDSKTMYSSPSLVPLSPFWASFAAYLRHPEGRFLSTDFIYCTHSFSEIIFCLSVLGLSLTNTNFTIYQKKVGYELTCDDAVMVFQKMVKEVDHIEPDSTLLVTQKYIDCNNDTEMHGNKKVERYMSANEFLPHQPYLCKVFITNMSAVEANVSVLYQIPSGSYPLLSPFFLHTEPITIPPYSTKIYQYSFYFPAMGDYTHFPAHLIDPTTSAVLVAASPFFQSLHVVDCLQTVDITSWRDVAASAEEDVVFEYLRTHDLTTVDWKQLLWRLTDKEFFLKLVSLLREYCYYNLDIWKYGVMHGDFQTTKDILSEKFANKVGSFFESPLLSVYPAEEGIFRIREYKPFIHNRCLSLGEKIVISNDKLKKQYEDFLEYLTYKLPTASDYALMVYYLILQDRVPDALKVFKTKVCYEEDGKMIRQPDCTCVVQCDYMIAYFDCYNEGLEQARIICEKYRNYPVGYWREMFANVDDLIKDYDSLPVIQEEEPVDMTNLPKNQIRNKRSSLEMDGSLTIKVKDEKVEMVTRNIPAVTVNLYELNVELMFSKKPFIRTSGSTSLFIRPNYSEQVTLTTDTNITTTEYLLPKAYRTKNVLVEVTADHFRETAFAFNTRLLVLISSKTGQLRVYDKETQRPLSSCYVKVYAETSSGTEFLKDGYTDIRGYFDYYSVSTDVAERASNLSIFIDKEGYGSCIRETEPPVSAM